MSRGTTLTNLLLMLKAEVGDSLSVGTQADARYTQLLANEQKFLVAEYAFPFMEKSWDKALVAGDRYLTFPTSTIDGASLTIDYERPLRVEVKYNDRWTPLCYGITQEDYNFQDSDTAEQLDPVRKWRYNGSAQFEVWPRPATAQTVRFTGQHALGALSVGSDTAYLDDELLVLSTAVPLLAKLKDPSVTLKLQKMQRRLQRLLGNYPQNEETVVLGQQQSDDRERRRDVKLVLVA
jgi:hypothetical protein